jgi:hypothetical protein
MRPDTRLNVNFFFADICEMQILYCNLKTENALGASYTFYARTEKNTETIGTTRTDDDLGVLIKPNRRKLIYPWSPGQKNLCFEPRRSDRDGFAYFMDHKTCTRFQFIAVVLFP